MLPIKKCLHFSYFTLLASNNASADPAMLEKVNAGDKIEFEADRVNGAITVTKMGKGH